MTGGPFAALRAQDAGAVQALLALALREAWSSASVEAALAMGGWGLVSTASVGSVPAAVVLVRDLPPEEAEILQLAVHPAVRRRGLGRALLAAALVQLAGRGRRRVLLEVRASNAAAQALYAGAGFRVAGRRPAYYSDGEDALVMALELDFPLPDLPT